MEKSANEVKPSQDNHSALLAQQNFEYEEMQRVMLEKQEEEEKNKIKEEKLKIEAEQKEK